MKQQSRDTRAVLAMLLSVAVLFGCRRIRLPQTLRTEHKKTVLTKELDFPVRNDTEQTWYISCFYWAKKIDVPVWRWYKSPIYKLEPGQEVIVDIDTFGNDKDRDDIYGWLTVFKSEIEADVATWATTPDKAKVQINKLSTLKKKKQGEMVQYEIVLVPEKYGFYGTIIDYKIVAQDYTKENHLPELDFWVENQTGDFLYITTFAYQHQREHMSWIHDAGDIIALPQGAIKKVDIETMEELYDWENVHGHLALFKTQGAAHPQALRGEAHDMFSSIAQSINAQKHSHEQAREKAEDATYELLEPGQNIKLPRLKKIHGKKVVLRKKPYGLVVDRKRRTKSYFIEYTIEDLQGKDSIFEKVSSIESLSGDKSESSN